MGSFWHVFFSVFLCSCYLCLMNKPSPLLLCDSFFFFFLLVCIFSLLWNLTTFRSAGRERHLQERSGWCVDQHKQSSSTTQEPHFWWLRSRLDLWAQISSLFVPFLYSWTISHFQVLKSPTMPPRHWRATRFSTIALEASFWPQGSTSPWKVTCCYMCIKE